ncbi:MAG: zinc ribbon domain-containing protein [Eggerthellaceae bacterium]|nr:zinc ribbon domain-containing protein [Eggerthellaceae bacterium]
MAINFCVNCGAKLDLDEPLCPACGEPVPQSLLYDIPTEGLDADQTPIDSYTNKVIHADSRVGDTASGTGCGVGGAASGAEGRAGETASSTVNGASDTAPDADSKPSDTASDNNSEEDFQKFADLSGFDIIGTYPAYAPDRARTTPTILTDPAPSADTPPATLEPIGTKSNRRTGHMVRNIALVTAILIVAAGIGLLANPHARSAIGQRLSSHGDASGQPGIVEQEAADASSAAASIALRSEALASVRDAKADVDEDAAFDQLLNTYDRLQSYNDRVYSCLQTYNSVIVVADKSQREAAAGIAGSLLSEIEKDIDALDSLGLGRGSTLYNDYLNVRQLLDDQYQRLAVIVESWEISLSYTNPYDHENEILEPLRRDINADGVNSYLADFDKRYWDSRPERSE